MKKIQRYIAILFLVGLGEAYSMSLVFANSSLSMGIFPRNNVSTTIKKFTPLSDYLSENLNTTVLLKSSPNYRVFSRRLKAGEFDLIYFNQYHYAEFNIKYGLKIILKNIEHGRDSISGIIVTRKDRGYSSLQDLKGSEIIFGGGESAMMAYIAPTFLLQQAGLAKGDYVQEFAVNPVSAVVAVYRGLADAAGVGDVVPEVAFRNGLVNKGELQILAKSRALPHLVWAVNKNMSETRVQNIKQLMLGLKDSITGQSILKNMNFNGFSPAQDNEYDGVRRMIKNVSDGKPL